MEAINAIEPQIPSEKTYLPGHRNDLEVGSVGEQKLQRLIDDAICRVSKSRWPIQRKSGLRERIEQQQSRIHMRTSILYENNSLQQNYQGLKIKLR